MAQTKPKAAQFYGVSGDGTAGQVLISDGNGGMSWGANTELFTVSWNTPTGQSLTYTQPNPQSSTDIAGATFPTTTFTATKAGEIISGTATIVGLPTGITASQSYNNGNIGNILTVTLSGVYPSTNSVGTNLVISGLTISVPITVDYLVLAGGGGGAGGFAGVGSGAGGAGGLRSSYGNVSGTPAWVNETALTLGAGTNYSVTIGAGGAGGPVSEGGIGVNGSSSVFYSITSIGGGGARSYDGNAAPSASGGSGGGASYGNPAGTANTSPISGNSGGAFSYNGNAYGGGGGGGAGSAGGNGSGSSGGSGGNGLQVNIDGNNYFYGGGGGGSCTYGNPVGSGGSGIGGNGAITSAGGAATVNRGSGGGGGGTDGSGYLGGAGSSGVVILRYPNAYTISGLSGTTTTVGSDKVTTFTNTGTGNIQFN